MPGRREILGLERQSEIEYNGSQQAFAILVHRGTVYPTSDVLSGYAYVADSGGGLRIINIANPVSPAEVGFFVTPNYAGAVAVSGSYAFVLNGWYGGLSVIDVSHPVNLAAASSYEFVGQPYDVVVRGQYAYVGSSEGLRIIDVLRPSRPTQVAIFRTSVYGPLRNIVISGTLTYLGDRGLIVDVSNPSAPAQVGTFTGGGRMIIAGRYAYVGGWDYMRILDLSNPTSPTVVGSYRTGRTAQDIAVDGDYAYVVYGHYSGSFNGIHILDVSDKANPRLVTTFATSIDATGDATGVAASGGRAYVADGPNGLRIVDVSNPASPTLISTYDTPGYARSVKLVGNHAYVADEIGGVRVIDVSTPANPREVAFYDTPGDSWNLDVAGAFIYVADRGGGLAVLSPDPGADAGSTVFLPLLIKN
ncbi:MAG: hypothetical protein HYY30_13440 [Chloroflexi bacterium]|nr:hypothetical protein [Chloroflexota bacterium]